MDVDVAEFADALERKRLKLGSDVVFIKAPEMIWPEGVAINPLTGAPYDASVEPVSSAASSATVRCGVFFHSYNRGVESLQSPIGIDERTKIFAIAPLSAAPVVRDAVRMIVHESGFKVTVVKDDEMIGGVRRLLVYGEGEG